MKVDKNQYLMNWNPEPNQLDLFEFQPDVKTGLPGLPSLQDEIREKPGTEGE